MTEVIGLYVPDALMQWRGRVGNKRADEIMHVAGAFGSRTHALIEDVLTSHNPTGAAFEEEPEAYLADQAYEWVRKNVRRVVAMEVGYKSLLYEYGGTFDALVELHDEPGLWMVDWKTSGAIKPTFGVQLAAYDNLYTENTGQRPQGGIIVRLDKKVKRKEPEVQKFVALNRYFDVFLGLRKLWDLVNEEGDFGGLDGKPREDAVPDAEPSGASDVAPLPKRSVRSRPKTRK